MPTTFNSRMKMVNQSKQKVLYWFDYQFSGTVQEFYRFNSEKDLKSQDFTIRDGMLEFLTLDLTTYAIIYRTETEAQQPSSSQIEEASPLANKKPAQW